MSLYNTIFPGEHRDELQTMSAQNEKTPCEKWDMVLSNLQGDSPSNDRTLGSHNPT